MTSPQNPAAAPAPPDLSNPSMRSWLAALPAGSGRVAAFETRIKWSPGRATSAIINGLKRAGYPHDRERAALHCEGFIRPASRRGAGVGAAMGSRAREIGVLHCVGLIEDIWARRWVWARSSRAVHHSEADFLKILVAIWTNSCYFNIELILSYLVDTLILTCNFHI